jgi:acid phosphatase type 7
MPGDAPIRLAWMRAFASGVAIATLLTACNADRTAPRLPQRTYVIAAVGDIACDEEAQETPSRDECRPGPVARAVEEIDPERLLLLGDIQYPSETGTVSYGSFDRSFGDFRSIWAPTPGDAEWEGQVDGYFDYFGAAAGPPGGYYSFELGAWHVLALNSQDCFDDDGCGEGTEQYEWLLDELDRHPAERFPCTLAFWHDPRFMWVEWWRSDDGPRGPVPAVRPLWQALDDGGAELTLGGNAHNYERWLAQDAGGAIDADGLTQFVVGTGGRRLNGAGMDPRPAALASFQDDAFGVLELQLGSGSYRWRWHSAPGEPPFDDEGTGDCR